MFGKRKKIILLSSIGIIVFLASYTITVGVLGDIYGGKDLFSTNSIKTNAEVKGEGLVNDTTSFKFKLKYKNSSDEVEANEKLSRLMPVDMEKLKGLNAEELNEIYLNFGYKVHKFTPEEIVLIKDMDGFNYQTDSFFIGINNNFISILKKNDNNEVEVVTEKISNPKSEEGSYISVKDIENKGNLLKTIYEGCEGYQFSNIQEAIEYAQALCST